MRNDRNFDRKEFLGDVITHLAGYQGTVTGVVVNNMNYDPIEGAVVQVVNSDRRAVTDANGRFTLTRVPNEAFNVIVTRDGYTRFELEMDFQGQAEMEAEIRMLHPEAYVNVDDYTGNVVVNRLTRLPVVVSNQGDGPLSLSMRGKGARIHSHMWDLMHSFSGRQNFNGGWLQAATFFNGYYWVAGGGDNTDDPNILFKLNREGELVEQTIQPTTSRYGWRDFTADQEYLYGADSTGLYQISTQDGQATGVFIPSPYNPTVAVAWDPLSDYFWVSGITTDISAIDRQGNVVTTIRNGSRFRIYGMAFNEEDPDNCPLYLMCNQIEQNGELLKLNLDTGSPTHIRNMELQSEERAGGCEISRDLYPYMVTLVAQMRSGPETIQALEIASNVPWLRIVPEQLELEGGQTNDIELRIDANQLELNQSYDAYVQIDHNAQEGELWIDLHVSVIEENGVNDGSLAPVAFGISSLYPNPFNSTARISYGLDRDGVVTVALFDLSGREVAVLHEGFQKAGVHQVSLSAEGIPSGLYMVKLTAATGASTRHLTLIK
jgi:hypothetical protein